MALKIANPLVLVLLDTAEYWSRGVLCGFAAAARELGWELLHYPASVDLRWIASQWKPAAAVFGLDPAASALAHLSSMPVVSVNSDRSADSIASVVPDDEEIGKLALLHFAARGLKDVTTFRLDDSRSAIGRERAFRDEATRARVRLVPSYPMDGVVSQEAEDPGALMAWLRSLPKPYGLFAGRDRWGRVIARYARAARIGIPEDLALLGCDNDVVECKLINPALSSIAVPWPALGKAAAELVHEGLAGKEIAGTRVVVSPFEAVPRRSSDVFAVDDDIVAEAVAWIYANVTERVTVPMVARAVGSGRQRLERRFRACLGRTIQEEIRRARVEVAKRTLSTTGLNLSDVARQSGFTSVALLSVAFQRELGMPPGAYRRRARAISHPDEPGLIANPSNLHRSDDVTGGRAEARG